MRSPLTQTFKRVTGMIDYVRENLDEEEYDLFLDLIVPEPEVKKAPTRKVKTLRFEHCEACNYTKRHQVHKDSSRSDYHEFVKPSSVSKSATKSRRAKSLGEALQRTPKPKDPARDDEGRIDSSKLCTFIINDATQETCGTIEDDPIHDLTYLSSHEFVGGVGVKAASGD